MRNYFINKDNKTGEIVYLEYDKNGYSVSPKAKKKNDIEVNKIVFVSPELTSKLLKKKIDIKINKLLNEYNTIDDDEDDDNGSRLRDKLKEAERLKITILNEYGKYLTDAYIKLTLKKLELIIDGYRSKLYSLRTKKQKEVFLQMFNQIEDNEKNMWQQTVAEYVKGNLDMAPVSGDTVAINDEWSLVIKEVDHKGKLRTIGLKREELPKAG